MNLTGKEWEELCEICLHEKFKDEIFIPITAETHGDWGIDGITETGIIFQCYAPENYDTLTSASLHEKLRDKINTDLNKIEKNKEEIAKLLKGKKIRNWILLTPRISNKEIHMYAAKKTKEYRNKNMEILGEEFSVVAEPISYIRNYIPRFNGIKKISYQESIDKYDAELEKKLNSDYLNNLDKKIKKLFSKSPNKITSLKENYILKYSIGLEVCSKFEEECPEIYKKVLEVIKNFELNLEEDTLVLSENNSDLQIFSKIKEKLENKMKETFSDELESTLIDKLKEYYISLWLLHCPLNFED